MDESAAGASALQKYRRLMINWWWEIRWSIAYFIGLAAVGLVAAIVFNVGPTVMFLLGASFGIGLFGATVAFAFEPREAANWRRGVEGEQSTGAQLEKLAAQGWQTVHDRALKKSNVDHVLVGPGGVFAIDSKNLSSRIEVIDGVLHTDGFANQRLARNARGIAAQINATIKAATPHNVWVEAVLVLWGDFEQNYAQGDRITYVAGETLTPWLHSRETVLKRDQIDAIVTAIAAMPAGVLLNAAEG